MTEKNQALLNDFVVESRELLDKAEGWLVALEASVEHPNPENVHNLFRAIHSVKGSANFLGLANIGEISHACENLLAEIRDGRLKINSDLIDVLLRSNDRLRALVEDVAFSDESDVTEELAELQGRVSQSPPKPRVNKVEIAEPAEAVRAPAAGTLRVRTAVLDNMLDAAGEMVTARNRLLSEIRNLYGEPESIELIMQQLDATMARMQSQIMRARLEPLTALLDRFRRVVRDLAATHGKQVDLLYSGDGVALDRAVLEVLSENLTHLLRNSVDHGIEGEAERLAAGKPRVGTIRIEASAQSDSVLIDVEDDGAGIDVARLLEEARAGDHWPEEPREDLDEFEMMRLISTPGLSTAREVSGLSGRGVGLDIVQGNVTRLGGSISVVSEKGRGTRFRLKLPMTLLILPTLVVEEQQCRFAIPRRFVEKVCRSPEPAGSLQSVGDATVLAYRGELVPVVSLWSLLEMKSPQEPVETSRQYVVVLQVGSVRVGLLVDKVMDHEEAVVSGLSRFLAMAPCYSGTTILGDGSIAMVLDPQRLVERAGLSAVDVLPVDAGVSVSDEPDESSSGAGEPYLLCAREEQELWAVGTAFVRQVRRIKRGELIFADGKQFIRYEGRSVPLIDSSVWTGRTADRSDEYPYAVIAGEGRELMAIGVSAIRDIVESGVDVQPLEAPASYLIGTIAVGDGVAGVLNVPALATALVNENGEN